MLKGTARECAAEFLGTFLLIVFGVGTVAQFVLSQSQAGSFLAINLGFGLAVTLAVYASGGVSGAHLNPAVTLALAVHRRFPWSKVLPYSLAQTAGAFAAAAVVYLVYHEALDEFTGGARTIATAGIWATYPQKFLSLTGGFVDQVVGTALLVAVIFALTDPKNTAPQANLTPVLVGATVAVIGMSFGFNAGYAINPARDFGPRLFTAVAGWGPEVFRAYNFWWWVPIVAPCVGGVLGGGIYDAFITKHHPLEA